MTLLGTSVLLEDTAESPLLVDAYRYVRHIWIVALTLCLYDYFLTLGSETKFMWRRPLLRSKVLFIINRYYALFYLLFGNFVMALTPAWNVSLCKAWFNVYIDCIFPMFITFFSLTLGRLHAAFNCSRQFMFAAGIFFGVEFTIIMTLQAVIESRFDVVILPPTWTGCIPMNTTNFSFALFILLATSEGALMIALLIKTLQILRQGYKPPKALVVILRDTALYAAFTASCIIFDMSQTGGMQSIFVAWPPLLVAVLATMGSRMLLNIHLVLEEARESEVSASMQLASMAFARSPRILDQELSFTSN